MSGETSRVNVSVDVLRNELTQLELRIVDRIASALELKADKAVVSEHDKRLTVLELSRAAREHLVRDSGEMEKRLAVVEAQGATKGDLRTVADQVDSLRSWHNKALGAFALVAFVMPILATISWHLWG